MVGTNQNKNLMNTRNFKIYTLLLGMVMALFACQPDEFSLGSLLSKEDLQYSITQNPNDPNMVILESLTPGMTPLWITPVGRSTKLKDTLRFPFAGDYQFIYGVQSAGGFVQADAYNLTITGNNFDYVTDPLWTMLTGGVGESKTWVLDLFPKDVAPNFSKYFVGPQYFWGTGDNWETFHLLADGVSRDEVNAQFGLTSATGWNWDADWAGNGSWLWGGGPAQFYGTMTFDLIDGPHLTIDNVVSGTQGSGTYMFDAKAKTMRTTDVAILHPASLETQVSDWTDVTVLNLTENTMQLGVIRTEGDPAMLVFNYISKEYSDNWVAPDLPDPEPPYNGNANEDLTTAVSTTKTWKIDMDIPYNWHGLDGSELNQVASTTSEGGFAFTTWAPPFDEAAFAAVTMSLTKDGDNGGTYAIETLTDFYEGSYTVDESNNIDFGQPITFFSGVGGWLTFGTTAENTLRIIISERDALGNVEGIWLGQRSPEKPEYISLHMVPQLGGGGSEGPQGTEVAFDNSKLVFGDLEGNGNVRLEIFNTFGSTNNDPGLDATAIKADNRMEITFTISGATLVDGASANYRAAIGFADGDWSAQYWGGGNGDATVTGNGTYTVYADPGAFDTATVFVIDIQGMATDLTDLGTVTATIDKIVLY